MEKNEETTMEEKVKKKKNLKQKLLNIVTYLLVSIFK